MNTTTSLQIIEITTARQRRTTLLAASDLCAMHPEMIREFVRANWIAASKHGDSWYVDEVAISRLRRIYELHFRSGINLRTVRSILGLSLIHI